MSAAGAPDAPPAASKAMLMTAVCLGMFMIQLDTVVVNVALPPIGEDLDASVSDLQWVIDGYMLALGSLMLIGGRLGDRFGNKRMFVTGLTLFTIGSALCALAPTSSALIWFRVLQGTGAALELPATLALLSSRFPDRAELAQAIGIWAGVAGLSLAIGPVLGGLVVDAIAWEAIFAMNIPIAIVAAVIAVRVIPEPRREQGGRLDVWGQLLGTAALALVVYAAIEGESQGWGSPEIVGLFAASAACLIGFLLVERRASTPVLPLGIFANVRFSAANVAGFVMGFALFGLLFLFVLYFAVVQGASPTETGLKFLPMSVVFVIVGPLVGRWMSRIGYRLPAALGLGLVAAGIASLTRADVETEYGSLVGSFVVIGVGYGLASAPLSAVVMSTVTAGRFGMASSVNNTARQVGGVFGVAIVGAILGAGGIAGVEPGAGYGTEFVDGLQTAAWVCALAALAGALVAARYLTTAAPETGPGPAAGDIEPQMAAPAPASPSLEPAEPETSAPAQRPAGG
jgi:EmrB/QacA subfamily drug resistance transporter